MVSELVIFIPEVNLKIEKHTISLFDFKMIIWKKVKRVLDAALNIINNSI